MDKEKQIKELIEKIKSGRAKLKDINPKLAFKILIDKLLAKVKVFAIGIGTKVVLGCLILGVILLCFAGLIELFKAICGFFQAVWDGIQYIWDGTKANVNSDEIADVREQIEAMGVEFDEIGYIGAIKLMGGVDDWDEYDDNFDDIKDDIEDDFEKIDVIQDEIDEKQKEYDKLQKSGAAQSDLDDAKKEVEKKEKELAKFQDKYIEFYITRYLEAQAQTGAAHNGFTFSDDDGASTIKHTKAIEKRDSLWARFKQWITGSYPLEYNKDTGKFITTLGSGKDKIELDVTKQIENIYMPWQYPFAFHNETMSPDVGYLVANLSQYHYLDLIIDSQELLILYVSKDDDGDYVIDDIFFEDDEKIEVNETKKGKGKETVYREPMVLIEELGTWAYTYEYDYKYKGPFGEILEYEFDGENSKFTDDSKEDLLDAFEEDDGDIIYKETGKSFKEYFTKLGYDGDSTVYYCTITLEGEGNSDAIENPKPNTDGYEEMKQILLPVPEFDEDGNITNESELPRYYIANASEKDEDGNYTREPGTLNIKTNAEAIIQAVDDIYRDEKASTDVIKGPKVERDSEGNIIRESNPITAQQFNEMKETTKAFEPDMTVKMVNDLVMFFKDEKVIDMASYFGSGLNAAFADLNVRWFLDAETDDVNIGSGNPATITAPAGTTVFAPISGEVEVDSNGDIYITKYGTYDEAQAEGIDVSGYDITENKIPIMKVGIFDLEGVSASLSGKTVTAGSTVLGQVGSTGKIEYARMNGDGSFADSGVLQDELSDAVAAENAQFILPLPADSGYSITSRFGPRVNPVTGVFQKAHGALDFGVAQGTNIYAAADGTVSVAGWNNGGYGYWVMIDHGGGYQTLYAHMVQNPFVRAGETIEKGQVLGKVGSTGNSTGPHLHFEIRVNGAKVDPEGYLAAFLNE